MSVDLRTRVDGDHEATSAADLFDSVLPSLLEAQRDAIVPGVSVLAPRPLTVEVDGDVWTLTWTGARVEVARGPDQSVLSKCPVHVRLSTEQLDDLVRDQATFMGFMVSGRLDQPRGRLSDLLDWWIVLRAALDGKPVHTPGAISFNDRDGATLDLARSFRVDDDPEIMRHFLQEAGFLHIVGLFSEREMAHVSSDMDRAAPSYAENDGRSWWASTGDGQRRLVRMQAFDQHSPTAAALFEGDDRLRPIAELTGDGHSLGSRRPDNRIEALFKPIGVVEGISDVPWHKDCSLGRHSYECCSLTVGISVTGADAASGQLRVVAGSHRALVWPAFVRPGSDLPEIPLPTQTGDVTVHLSCTMHMAQPPVERERRVLYTGFSLPPVDARAAARGRARLREVREAAPVTVSQKPVS